MEAPGEKAARGPVLTEAVVSEVLFRLPPDQPACLFRAAAVCQAWRALLTSPDQLRIYRGFHTAPPVLGFLQNTGRSDEPFPRFVATAAPSPPLHHRPEFECKYGLALDCRHGRVLLHPGAVMNSPDDVMSIMGPSLLAGDALYFTLDLLNNRTVLRVIDLEMSIPFTIGAPITQLKVTGFAEMSGTIFVSANGIISSVQLRSDSGRVSKFSRTPNSDKIFYTLGTQQGA